MKTTTRKAPRPAPARTNMERITEFMEFGSPLNQAFVMDAVTRIAERILADPDAMKAAMEKNGSHNFINPDAWIQCAEQWKRENPEYFTK